MLNLSVIPSVSAQIVISLAVMLLAGFLVTRVTKKLRLPNVTGYILAGVAVGPYALNIVPADLVARMDFVTDIALAFIAFGVGKYFKLSKLKKNGRQVAVVTIFESLTAAALVTLAMYYLFHLSLAFSLLLGAIASATAPASTIMTIRQYKAKGPFVNMILQVVALDDAVALIAFSVCAAVARSLGGSGGLGVQVVLLPLLWNLVALLLGSAAGFCLHKLIDCGRSSDHRLILATAIVLCITGFCTAFDVSPLLSCMVMGTVYINLSKDKHIFKQVNNFTPAILLLFFVLSGMRLNIPMLATAGLIGVAYFFIRIIGKYIGAFVGSAVGRAAPDIRRYLGLALIPQAGVSIGLAVLGQRLLPADMGAMLSTIILSSGILYEMAGPACAKASLFLSHSIARPKEAAEPEAPAVLPAAVADAQPEHRRAV